MKEAVVVDSTCLIGLERIGRLDLLPGLFDPIIAPSEVSREFGSSLPWLKIEEPSNKSFIAALKLLVDDGEAEAIALATEKQFRIVTDDRQARNVAQQLNLSIIGTIGILVKAKQIQIIPAIKPLINDLESNGFFLSPALKAQALAITGE